MLNQYPHAVALVSALLLGACSERNAPPKDWHKALNADELADACEPLIGRAGRYVSRFGSEVAVADVIAREDTPDCSATRTRNCVSAKPDPWGSKTIRLQLPATIAQHRPQRVSISPIDVDIQLGSYVHKSGEQDYWGVVCSNGSFRGAFLKRDATTFLTKLSDHLWYYDGVM